MAGGDAALAAARAGVAVDLHEMRPQRMTPAHKTEGFAEMVCSNSFGGEAASNAKGLLQAEMLAASGVVMTAASNHRVPAGGADALGRALITQQVTRAVTSHPLVTVHPGDSTAIPQRNRVLTTGPLP